MQAYAFPRTSGARNPVVIVKIFRAQAGNLRDPFCFSKDHLFFIIIRGRAGNLQGPHCLSNNSLSLRVNLHLYVYSI